MQLFALARAILQHQMLVEEDAGRKPILLLDEATSLVDSKTESLILDIIREEFSAKGLTVISVSHRSAGLKETSMSSDGQMLLLSQGRMEAFGRAEDVLAAA